MHTCGLVYTGQTVIEKCAEDAWCIRLHQPEKSGLEQDCLEKDPS